MMDFSFRCGRGFQRIFIVFWGSGKWSVLSESEFAELQNFGMSEMVRVYGE
jgi:hypothetical protein